LLDRESVTEDRASAVYKASIYTTSELFTYRATLGLDGTAVVVADSAVATEADSKQLTNIAKSTARAAKRKLDEDLPPWPPRILRWRAPR
jgi:phosphotransacetylase